MPSGWEPIDAVVVSEEGVPAALDELEKGPGERTARLHGHERSVAGGIMPERFAAMFRRGTRTLVVEVRLDAPDGERPEAEVAGVWLTSDRPLTATDPQRIPWGAIFDEAVALGIARLAFDEENRPANPEWAETYGKAGAADAAAIATMTRQLRRRRGKTLTPEHLLEVAEVARANPKRPAMSVAETWGVGRTTASYWIKRATETEDQR